MHDFVSVNLTAQVQSVRYENIFKIHVIINIVLMLWWPLYSISCGIQYVVVEMPNMSIGKGGIWNSKVCTIMYDNFQW